MNFQSINSQEKEKASIHLVITKALMQNGESDLIEEATKNPEKIHEVTKLIAQFNHKDETSLCS